MLWAKSEYLYYWELLEIGANGMIQEASAETLVERPGICLGGSRTFEREMGRIV